MGSLSEATSFPLNASMAKEAPPWVPAAICSGCMHRQLRGGIVFAKRWECVVLESEHTKTAILMTRMIQAQAQQGECPAKEELVVPEGGYLSEDLPP